MINLTLKFSDPATKEQVLTQLHQPDSGFEPDTRQPLDSAVDPGVAVAVVGVLVNTAQLAVAIWAIKKANSDAKKARVEAEKARAEADQSELSIEVVRADGTTLLLKGTNVEGLEAEIGAFLTEVP